MQRQWLTIEVLKSKWDRWILPPMGLFPTIGDVIWRDMPDEWVTIQVDREQWLRVIPLTPGHSGAVCGVPWRYPRDGRCDTEMEQEALDRLPAPQV